MTRRDAIAAPFLQLGRKAKPTVAGGYVMDAFALGHKLVAMSRRLITGHDD